MLPDARDAVILAEPMQVEQVLINLVANARDAMPSGGTVSIALARAAVAEDRVHRYGRLPRGDYVALQVRDSGTGMTAEVQEHLFEPFFTTKTQGEGTGLGLPMVHGIVGQSGGSILVETVPGHGSMFTVYWPLAVAESARAFNTAAVAPVLPPGERKSSPRVLLVDDEVAIRRVVERLLRRLGFEVFTAGNGAEALHLMVERGVTFDALITDVRMPGMTGVELVGSLLSQGIDLPVLLISGQIDSELPRDWPDTSPRGFLKKPFSRSDLVVALAQLVPIPPQFPH